MGLVHIQVPSVTLVRPPVASVFRRVRSSVFGSLRASALAMYRARETRSRARVRPGVINCDGLLSLSDDAWRPGGTDPDSERSI